MSGAASLETVLKRDRLIVLAGLLGVTALAWIYLLVLAAGMRPMDSMAPISSGMLVAQIKPWSVLDFTVMFLMWVVMMIGMMLPSATPMILLFSSVARKQKRDGNPYVGVGVFVVGYALAWTAFSLIATGFQWLLEQAALLSPAMASASPYLGFGLLAIAGGYQFTPQKRACLIQCRTPAVFVSRHWRTGTKGTLFMGMHHGAFCVGCCWALMCLLFVGGVMNLLWVAVIAAFVLIEKTLPAGVRFGRLAGVVLIGLGLWQLLASFG
jgi:predicted metal-binding membrane protein